MTSPYYKVKLVKSLEREYGLDFLIETGANKADMADDLYKLIKHTFRLRKAKPTTIEWINALYASLIRSITNDKTLVTAGKKEISTNINAFQFHLELNKLKNKNQLGFSNSTMETFGIEVASVPKGLFGDVLDDIM